MKKFLFGLLMIIVVLFASCAGGGYIGGNGITVTVNIFDPDDFYYNYEPNPYYNPTLDLQVFINGEARTDRFFEDSRTIQVNKGDVLSAVIRYDGRPNDCFINGGFGFPKTYTISENTKFYFYFDMSLMEEGL